MYTTLIQEKIKNIFLIDIKNFLKKNNNIKINALKQVAYIILYVMKNEYPEKLNFSIKDINDFCCLTISWTLNQNFKSILYELIQQIRIEDKSNGLFFNIFKFEKQFQFVEEYIDTILIDCEII